MNDSFPVDIEQERVQVGEAWLSFDELTTQIRERVERGDFHVARLSLALETLERTLATLETIELKLAPNLLRAYRELASAQGETLDATFRRALRLQLHAIRSNAPHGTLRSQGH